MPHRGTEGRGELEMKARSQHSDELLEECVSNDARTTVDIQLHPAHFAINFLHEVNDEVHELVLQHFFCVEVRDQEGHVVALDWFPSEDDELFGTLGQKPGKLVYEDVLHFVRLLNFNTDADGVD